jgi:hypothetical protein
MQVTMSSLSSKTTIPCSVCSFEYFSLSFFVLSPPKLIYVDHIATTGMTPDVGVHLIKSLSDSSPIKDLGTLDYFLGLEAPYNSGGMILTYRKHALDLCRGNLETVAMGMA